MYGKARPNSSGTQDGQDYLVVEAISKGRYRSVIWDVALAVAFFHLSLAKGHEKLPSSKGHRHGRFFEPEGHSRDCRAKSRTAADERVAKRVHVSQYPACGIAGGAGCASGCATARYRPHAGVRTRAHGSMAYACHPCGPFDQDSLYTPNRTHVDRVPNEGNGRLTSLRRVRVR